MGSFCEAVLQWEFREDTPDEVLAAFSALPVATGPDLGPSAPVRPDPVPRTGDEADWIPDWTDAYGEPDPHADAMWRHDFAPWLSTGMSVATTPYASMDWVYGDRWRVSCRFSWKCGVETVFGALEWLGPYLATATSDAATLVGYLHDDYAPRPHLVWAQGGRLRLEDLNIGERWRYGDVRPPVLRVITGLPASGKSTMIAQLREQAPGEAYFDDFQAESIGHRAEPAFSRYFGALLQALADDGQVTVTDRRYCDVGEVRAVLAAVRSFVPEVRISLRSFANDPAACRANVARRASKDAGYDTDRDLGWIEHYTQRYRPGGDAIAVPTNG